MLEIKFSEVSKKGKSVVINGRDSEDFHKKDLVFTNQKFHSNQSLNQKKCRLRPFLLLQKVFFLHFHIFL